MVPFGGQGSKKAMEDAGALGYLFKNINDPADIESLLTSIELFRKTGCRECRFCRKSGLVRKWKLSRSFKNMRILPAQVRPAVSYMIRRKETDEITAVLSNP